MAMESKVLSMGCTSLSFDVYIIAYYIPEVKLIVSKLDYTFSLIYIILK